MANQYPLLSEAARDGLVSAVVNSMGLQRIHLMLITDLIRIPGVSLGRISRQYGPDTLRLGLDFDDKRYTREQFEEMYRRIVCLDSDIPHDETGLDPSIIRDYQLSRLRPGLLDTIVEIPLCVPQ